MPSRNFSILALLLSTILIFAGCVGSGDGPARGGAGGAPGLNGAAPESEADEDVPGGAGDAYPEDPAGHFREGVQFDGAGRQTTPQNVREFVYPIDAGFPQSRLAVVTNDAEARVFAEYDGAWVEETIDSIHAPFEPGSNQWGISRFFPFTNSAIATYYDVTENEQLISDRDGFVRNIGGVWQFEELPDFVFHVSNVMQNWADGTDWLEVRDAVGDYHYLHFRDGQWRAVVPADSHGDFGNSGITFDAKGDVWRIANDGPDLPHKYLMRAKEDFWRLETLPEPSVNVSVSGPIHNSHGVQWLSGYDAINDRFFTVHRDERDWSIVDLPDMDIASVSGWAYNANEEEQYLSVTAPVDGGNRLLRYDGSWIVENLPSQADGVTEQMRTFFKNDETWVFGSKYVESIGERRIFLTHEVDGVWTPFTLPAINASNPRIEIMTEELWMYGADHDAADALFAIHYTKNDTIVEENVPLVENIVGSVNQRGYWGDVMHLYGRHMVDDQEIAFLVRRDGNGTWSIVDLPLVEGQPIREIRDIRPGTGGKLWTVVVAPSGNVHLIVEGDSGLAFEALPADLPAVDPSASVNLQFDSQGTPLLFATFRGNIEQPGFVLEKTAGTWVYVVPANLQDPHVVTSFALMN
ncbi:hypothetical protein K8I61_06460 [bacterium]|nr:hypothetical protein [bacterium]